MRQATTTVIGSKAVITLTVPLKSRKQALIVAGLVSSTNAAYPARVKLAAVTNPVAKEPFFFALFAGVATGVLSLMRARSIASGGASLGGKMANSASRRKNSRRKKGNKGKKRNKGKMQAQTSGKQKKGRTSNKASTTSSAKK